MNTFDFTCFTSTIFIHSSPQDVYRYWTQANMISQFWPIKAIHFRGNKEMNDSELKTGDVFKLSWLRYPTEGIRILGFEENKLFTFLFGENDSVTEVVTIKLEAKNGGTLLSLTQDHNSSLEVCYECKHTWAFVLTNLKSVIEHKIDLRENKVLTADSVNSF